jgi:hypothetical protein
MGLGISKRIYDEEKRNLDLKLYFPNMMYKEWDPEGYTTVCFTGAFNAKQVYDKLSELGLKVEK